jgi:hypothetical protein
MSKMQISNGLWIACRSLCVALAVSGCTQGHGGLPATPPHAEIVGFDDAQLMLEIDGKFLLTESVAHVKLDQLRAVPFISPGATEPIFQAATTAPFSFSRWVIKGLWSNPSLDWPYVVAIDDELVRARPLWLPGTKPSP